jgi:drug/metabolite transporter (DMT)-like permease
MKRIRACTPELFTLCLTYTVAAAMEYWLVNWLKLEGLNLPVFFAIIQNSAWPLQLYFYICELKRHDQPRVITPHMWRSYFLLGALASVITMTRMAGLSSLPPSLYVICANTETVFETLMTRTILKRKVRSLQWMAAFLVCLGVVVAIYDPSNRRYGAGSMGGQSRHERNIIVIGVLMSVGSRWASALNVILAEK